MLNYQEERKQGIHCINYRCSYNDRGFQQSCMATHCYYEEGNEDLESCLISICNQYSPENIVQK